MRLTLLALAAAAAVGSGVSSTSAIHHNHHHHQARTSLNYGPATARRISAHHANDARIAAFNQKYAFPDDPILISLSGHATGLTIADAFLAHLHPAQAFRLHSTTLSARDTVLHAHFIQTLHGRDIVNAIININIDLLKGSIVSYGDSAYVPTTSCKSETIVGYASQLTQVIFGQSATPADGEQCVHSASEAVADKHVPIDPRIALANFIIHANPELVSSFASTDDLVDQMTITQSLSNGAGHTLHDVPGAVSDDGVPAKLAYIEREDGTLALIWSFEYAMNNNWYEAHISADALAEDVTTPLMVVDWQRDAPSKPTSTKAPKETKPSTTTLPKARDYSYRVYGWGTNDPSEGKRELIKNPAVAHKLASPAGWHSVPKGSGRDSGDKNAVVASPDTSRNNDDEDLYEPGWSSSSSLKRGATFRDTRSNNVFAQDNPSGGTSFETNYRPQHDENGVFDFKLGWGSKENRTGHQVDYHSYINVSITELFYTNNEIHDFFYGYGFDEQSGNFQEHNFGRGGLGNDAVVAMAQDGSGMNNANFATPPDGQRPRMRMYAWNGLPDTDGDLEAGIVIHEYSHGISTRLTGGPANSGCLGWSEAGGMGEGYGDFFATMIRMAKHDDRDFTMGSWAAHRDAGIRKYPYSTNMTHNPSTYKILDGPGYWGVHAIGEVYAVMLFEVADALVHKHGFIKDLFVPSTDDQKAYDDFFIRNEKTGRTYPRYGNAYVIQLVMDAFKAQKCRPGFFDHRDAMIHADQLYTGGENECLIIKAFAKRGLGPDASVRGGTPWGGGVRTDDFSLPKKCVGKST